MPALKELKEQYTSLALKAHEVVASDRTAAEIREALDKIEPDLKALSDQIADTEFVEEKRKSYADITGGSVVREDPEQPTTPQFKSLGEEFVNHANYKAIADPTNRASIFQSGPIELKATLTESGLTAANVIVQDRQPGILPILFQRLTVADLIPGGSTNSNTVRYAKESTATNAASSVAENGAKPESTLNFTTVDDPVRKIATTIKVSDEMLEDLAQMQSYINGRLVLFVRIEEEAQLLTGNGVSPDLTGLLNRSGLTAAQAKSNETYGPIAIAVHKEITKIRVASFLDPDGIIFHPNDWEQACFEGDANGQFFGGGPFTGAYGVGGSPGALESRSYWGLTPVITTAMTENTALIAAFRAATQIFRRTGVTVEMTNSNEDDFKHNLVAMRAEERLALAVYRPSAIGTVTGI